MMNCKQGDLAWVIKVHDPVFNWLIGLPVRCVRLLPEGLPGIHKGKRGFTTAETWLIDKKGPDGIKIAVQDRCLRPIPSGKLNDEFDVFAPKELSTTKGIA